MYDFEFEKPSSISDAITLLSSEEAMPLSGGQTLIPALKQRLNAPSKLVSLAGIPELRGVSVNEGGMLEIKGATTHAVIAKQASSHYPALSALASHIGDPAVRNRGTIGGSLANNDPAACYPAAVLASNGKIISNKREINSEDFFQGMFTTALDEGELITAVQFEIPTVANYQKFLQPASRFALTGVFVAKFDSGVRVAITGASENGVFRWSEAEALLSDNFSPSSLDVLTFSTDGLISDLHGTPAYRASLIKTLTKRAVIAAK
ncbi:MAG: xanthine dehydrogenase family protein subunit M [Aestuariivita sp.]|nr:xanthine dehydrogenase family protein subunit M [Aestuariivita sp.]